MKRQWIEWTKRGYVLYEVDDMAVDDVLSPAFAWGWLLFFTIAGPVFTAIGLLLVR